MSPEAKLADYARHIHLQDEDVDYLLGLLQEARGLGSKAGAEAEREACAEMAERYRGYRGDITENPQLIANAIRARGKE